MSNKVHLNKPKVKTYQEGRNPVLTYPWTTATNATEIEIIKAIDVVGDMYGPVYSLSQALSPEQERALSMRIRKCALLDSIRLAEQLALQINALGRDDSVTFVNELRELRKESEHRLRMMDIIESDLRQEIDPLDIMWFGEQGEVSDLLWLSNIGHSAMFANSDTLQRIHDVEHSIIYHISEDSERWIAAVSAIDPEEKVWLVTALIARVVLRKKEDGTYDLCGNADQPTSLRVSVDQQQKLIEMLQNEDDELRAECAYALGECGDSSAIPALRQSIVSDKNPLVRSQAYRALNLIGGVDALSALTDIISGESDLYPLMHAIDSLENLLHSMSDITRRRLARHALIRLIDAPGTHVLARSAVKRVLEDEPEIVAQ